MKFLYTLLLFVITLSFCQAQRNTILIIADDLSPDYFGFYENYVDTVDVPNIRSLLARGVRFTNLSSNPVCSSTRATILTGRYGFRTGVGGIVGGIGDSGQIDTAEISIPKLLKAHNPNTRSANIGKWHLKKAMPAINLISPLSLGYDHAEGPFIGQLPSFTAWTKYTNGVASNVTTYASTENVNNAIDWVKAQNPEQPFFLWLAFNAPHEPLHLPPLDLHNYDNLNGLQANINAQPKAYFKAMVQAMDTEIGRLMDSLEVLNLLDSTDIIFIGDNGNTQKTAQITDLNKAKGTVYEYGVHVPLIISGPSVVNPNRKSDALVNTVDLFATILELQGANNWSTQIPVNKPVDSKSMLPIIKNIETEIRPWAFCEIFKLTTDSSDGKAMRNLDYKLIRFDYGAEAFYRLSDDPLEDNNLINTTMSAADSLNYTYLCTEMTNLLGTGNICTFTVSSANSINYNNISAAPNPFTDKIAVQHANPKDKYCLYNTFGQIVFEGANIEQQNFSFLSQGVYYLHKKDSTWAPLRLVKL